MKTTLLVIALILSVGVQPMLATPASIEAGKTAASDAAWLAKAKADYPLKTCAVSGEDLGSMGEPFDYIHQAADQPARLVRMCCEGCVKKFKKDPAKFLAVIDAAAEAGKHSNHAK